MDWLSAITYLLAFGSLLFMVYITTRFIGGKAANAMRGKHINVIETISLGLDKRIHLMKVGDEYILIATSGKKIYYLKTISFDESEEETERKENSAFDFKRIFEKYSKTEDKKQKDAGRSPFRLNLDKIRSITRKNDAGEVKDTNEE